jgi:hypothetical protein
MTVPNNKFKCLTWFYFNIPSTCLDLSTAMLAVHQLNINHYVLEQYLFKYNFYTISISKLVRFSLFYINNQYSLSFITFNKLSSTGLYVRTG